MQGCNYFIVILILRKNNLHEGVTAFSHEILEGISIAFGS